MVRKASAKLQAMERRIANALESAEGVLQMQIMQFETMAFFKCNLFSRSLHA
jgi:hypothetical protein